MPAISLKKLNGEKLPLKNYVPGPFTLTFSLFGPSNIPLKAL
jgi:hypothetical protein